MSKDAFALDKPLCKSCRYWAAIVQPSGECHRYAPRPIENQFHTIWPDTFDTDWCGEWSLAIEKGTE